MNHNIFRKILAVITGAIIGSITLLIVGMIANAIKPTPPELMDSVSPEAVALRVSSAPIFTWLSTIFGMSLGSFFGGVIGGLIIHEKTTQITSAIGLVLSIWAFYTFYIVYPDVLWVPALMLIFTLLFTYLGGSVITRSRLRNS